MTKKKVKVPSKVNSSNKPSTITSTTVPITKPVLSLESSKFDKAFYEQLCKFNSTQYSNEALAIIQMFHYRPLKIIELGSGNIERALKLFENKNSKLDLSYKGFDFSSFKRDDLTNLQSLEIINKDFTSVGAEELQGDLLLALGVLEYLPLQGVKAILETLAFNYYPLSEFILFSATDVERVNLTTKLDKVGWIKLFQQAGFSHIEPLSNEFSSKVKERPYYLVFSCV